MLLDWRQRRPRSVCYDRKCARVPRSIGTVGRVDPIRGRFQETPSGCPSRLNPEGWPEGAYFVFGFIRKYNLAMMESDGFYKVSNGCISVVKNQGSPNISTHTVSFSSLRHQILFGSNGLGDSLFQASEVYACF